MIKFNSAAVVKISYDQQNIPVVIKIFQLMTCYSPGAGRHYGGAQIILPALWKTILALIMQNLQAFFEIQI